MTIITKKNTAVVVEMMTMPAVGVVAAAEAAVPISRLSRDRMSEKSAVPITVVHLTMELSLIPPMTEVSRWNLPVVQDR